MVETGHRAGVAGLPAPVYEGLAKEGAPQIFCLHGPGGSLWRVLEFGED